MLEIVDAIIWLSVVIFMLLIPFYLIFILWGDSTFWLRMLGTSLALFCIFLFIGKVTDRLLKTGGLGK